MGQQLHKQASLDILSYLPPRDAARIVDIPRFGAIIGARDLTIRTSEMTMDFMIQLATEHTYLTKLTLEIDDNWGNVDQTRDHHLDLPNLTHLVLRSTHMETANNGDVVDGCKPLEDWAPWLNTLDITGLNTHTDVELVWDLFPYLRRLKYFHLTWIAIYLLFDHQTAYDNSTPAKLESLYITMDPYKDFTEISLDCMRWIKFCAVEHPSCALYCMVPKWTAQIEQCFVSLLDDRFRMLPPNSAFSHFHLEVHEIENDRPMPRFFLLERFISNRSTVYVNIKATGIENHHNIKWIGSIVEGLAFCKDIKTIIHLQCATWSDDMNIAMSEIAWLMLGPKHTHMGIHDQLYHKTLHVSVVLSGEITPDIATRWNLLKTQPTLDRDYGIVWDHMLAHKAVTLDMKAGPKNLKVKLRLPPGFTKRKRLESVTDPSAHTID
jgi:hypothetical protein